MLSRRNLLTSIAPGAAAVALAGCSTAQLANIQTSWTNFVDQVNAILATGCSTVVPAFTASAGTIEAVVNILYPGVGAAVGGIIGSVSAVATALCSTVPIAPPAALAKKLAKSSPRLPVIIGTTTVVGPNGVPVPITVHGYK